MSPTRLYMAMLATENPTIHMPNNLGDVLYTTELWHELQPTPRTSS